MEKEKVDQIVEMIFSYEVKEGFVGNWGEKGESVDFIPEMVVENSEACDEILRGYGEEPDASTILSLEDVNTVFYILQKAGIFEPQDEKGNWWSTPLYWTVFDAYHSLENRIEKDRG
jgi:hypothetical protein